MIGPCAKAVVRCTIIAPNGERYIGENFCMNPQPLCPRAPGEDYEKCESVCRQVGHAEVVAAAIAGHRAAGGVAYIAGHSYACGPCQEALAAIGIDRVIIGSAA